MELERYSMVRGDGELIVLNGAFTPDELRQIIAEAEAPYIQRCTGVEIDTDELLL